MEKAKQIWEETAKRLEKVYDRRESENIAYLLMEDVFGINKSEVIVNSERNIDSVRWEKYLSRLINHEPIQYITERADFFGRKFKVSDAVLIPRPETEELVDLILKENLNEKPKILDVGVGSGCIAITLAIETGGEVYGTDISSGALRIAKDNANSLSANVEFFLHDVLVDDLTIADLDILVSNPPYIPRTEKGQMRKNVINFEPNEALFVKEDAPLIFYKRIADEGIRSLKIGGKLYFEIHERFGDDIKALLVGLGYSDVSIHKDMQGKDRMVSATNSANK